MQRVLEEIIHTEKFGDLKSPSFLTLDKWSINFARSVDYVLCVFVTFGAETIILNMTIKKFLNLKFNKYHEKLLHLKTVAVLILYYLLLIR